MASTAVKVLIAGIILLIVGLIIGIGSFGMIYKDPSQEAVATLDILSGVSTDVTLKEGDYEIWYEEGDLFDSNDPGDVVITDSDGNTVYEDTSLFSSTESMSVNGKSFRKEGSFEAKSSGDYTVTVEDDSKIYITKPIDIASGISICITGVILVIVSGILILIALILYIMRKKSPPPYQQYPAGYPAQGYQQPPAQQPGYQQPPPPPPPQYPNNY
jgi:hypothetical protein